MTEPNSKSQLPTKLRTYEKSDNPDGQKCGQTGSSTTFPPELVELAKHLASLSPEEMETILRLVQSLSTSQKPNIEI